MNRLSRSLALGLLALPAVADPRLPAIFGDHMVLQQGRRVPMWGWADPGERITVTIGSRDVPSANYPGIRLFVVPQESVLKPRDDVRSAWRVCTPETAARFSAASYLFGRELHQKLNVPVGLIGSYWGGTNAEEWTAPAALRSDRDLAPILERWEKTASEIKQLYEKPFDYELFFRDFEFLPPARYPGSAIAEWEAGSRLRGGDHTFAEEGGAVVLRGRLKAGEIVAPRANFHKGGAPADLSAYEGLRFRVRGSGFFKVHVIEPSINDWDNYATQGNRAFGDWTTVTVPFQSLKQAGWGKKQPFTAASLIGALIEIQAAVTPPPRPPSGLYNGMIHPLAPYAIRGGAWYQGEGNAGRSYQYRKLLPAMIRSWRALWAEGDFPFLIVQLPNFHARRPDPGESAWAELREAQLMTLRSTPRTGLAVTIDAGEADDVHPRDKLTPAERLAHWALGAVYRKEKVYSGPLYASMTKRGDRIRLKFTHTGSGLTAQGGESLKGFAVAGADRKFRWAEAWIEGKNVVVWNSEVPGAVAVRYAWADNPDCNLFSKEGLPASPFRTDD